jgi:putative glutathione S-transferase
MGEHGWPFASVDAFPEATEDPLHNSEHVKDLYYRADPDFEGKFTVPVLWDKKTHTIVNNESSEIIRMLNSAFNDFLPEERKKLDYYPEALRNKIDELNRWIYSDINSMTFFLQFVSLANLPWIRRRCL